MLRQLSGPADRLVGTEGARQRRHSPAPGAVGGGRLGKHQRVVRQPGLSSGPASPDRETRAPPLLPTHRDPHPQGPPLLGTPHSQGTPNPGARH